MHLSNSNSSRFENIKTFLKKIVVKNFFNLFLDQALNILISILITPVIFQNIGEKNFGLVNLSLSIVYLLSIAVAYGYNLNAPKLISILKNDKTILEKLLNEIISLRLFIATIVTLGVITIFLLFGNNGNDWIILIASLIVLYSEALYPIFYLQGKDEINTLVFLNFFSKIIYCVLIILFVKNSNHSYLINLLLGLSSLFSGGLFWIIIYKRKKFNWKWSGIKELKIKFKENFDYFVSTIGSYIMFNGGIIILSNYVDDSELGQFSLSQKVALQLRMIPVFFVQSILQKVSILNNEKDQHMNYFLNKIYFLGLCTTALVCLFIIILSKWIVFYFAGDFIDYSQNILTILSLIPFMAMLNFKNVTIMIVKEKNKLLNYAISISTIVMIILSIIGSTMFGGYGLCVALVLSEFLSFIIHSYLVKK